MRFIKDKWAELPLRRRVIILALGTCASAILVTLLLLSSSEREVVYKAF